MESSTMVVVLGALPRLSQTLRNSASLRNMPGLFLALHIARVVRRSASFRI